jgi:RimJ/RimL family protein N-acetyltransferase
MMFTLPPESYPSVRPLFDPLNHNRAIVFSVLEGLNPGAVYVDRLENPRAALLASITGYNYLAGQVDLEDFNAALVQRLTGDLKPAEDYMLLLPCTEAWQGAISSLWADAPGEWGARLEYDFPAQSPFTPGAWHRDVMAGYTVRPFDRELASQIPEVINFWDSLDHFEQCGLGVAVLHGGHMVSHCISVLVGSGLAEISIETRDSYRRLGLAYLAARAFFDACQPKGLIPHWSCWDYNTASQQLAEKLGFQFVCRAPVRVFFLKPPA